MHNWSCDIKALRKRSKRGAERFELEQKINYGLGKEKLSRKQLLHWWPRLTLDPLRKRFLSFLLWPTKS